MLSFIYTKEQEKALESLAYWVADVHYIKERYGKDPELITCDKTIQLCCFPECDRLKIPFWVQNTVICFAENWRQYKEMYLCDFLKTKNIIRGF